MRLAELVPVPGLLTLVVLAPEQAVLARFFVATALASLHGYHGGGDGEWLGVDEGVELGVALTLGVADTEGVAEGVLDGVLDTLGVADALGVAEGVDDGVAETDGVAEGEAAAVSVMVM